ncbi:MAG: phosphoribosylformylglycinamidine cyclo-ligase [Candidatus Altiarchaeota archaeon]|nr:phosphoribosylformylglycinamidine cyclo-ligase [Candidatus Altiarchaeota archaeon]
MKTYKESGVDIEAEDVVIQNILSVLKTKLSGHFAGIVEFGDYYLSMCTDGVGSKVLVAEYLKKYDTVGIDMVAMNVNDVITIGARPIALVDYLAVEKIEPEKINEIINGVAEGARQAGCEVISGETATLPDVIKGFDLAGSCLGVVEKNKIVTGEKIRDGDVVIGLESSGIHSNGLTLARKVLDLDRWGEELLKPTRIYVEGILSILDQDVHGLSHITGGGLRKLKRILPKGLGAEITNPLEPQKVFKEIQKLGEVGDYEMYRTFNMGMGFAIVADESSAKGIQKKLKSKSKVVGAIVTGDSVSVSGKDVVL